MFCRGILYSPAGHSVLDVLCALIILVELSLRAPFELYFVDKSSNVDGMVNCRNKLNFLTRVVNDSCE